MKHLQQVEFQIGDLPDQGVGYAYGPDYAMPHSMIVDRTGRRYCDDSFWVDIVEKTMETELALPRQSNPGAMSTSLTALAAAAAVSMIPNATKTSILACS